MKIAIVLPRNLHFSAIAPTSIDTVARHFAENSEYRSDIRVFCTHSDGTIDSLDVCTIAPQKRWLSALLVSLRAFQPDLIEVHQHVPSAAWIARNYVDCPVVCFRHNHSKPPSLLKRYFIKYRRLMPLAHFIFVSDFCRSQFIDLFPEFQKKASTVYNAIPITPWLGSPSSKENIIAFSGRLDEKKGVEPFAQALAYFLPHSPEWKAVLITSISKSGTSLEKRVEKILKPLQHQVRWYKNSPPSQVQEIMKRVSIMVIPSAHESFGLVALESHIAGAAIISSGVGGLREVSQENAFYLTEITSRGIVHSLEVLTADSALRNRLQTQGQQYVFKAFSIAAQAKKLDTIRQEICFTHKR